jgi:hypothetical protein
MVADSAEAIMFASRPRGSAARSWTESTKGEYAGSGFSGMHDAQWRPHQTPAAQSYDWITTIAAS